MGLDKFKKMFEDSEEVEYEGTNPLIDENNNKMILVEPRAFSESQQIADYLKSGVIVVASLNRVTNDQAKRVVDFLSGTVYAIGGDLQKIGNGTFLCTPKTVQIQGKITEEEANGFNDRLDNSW